MAKNDFDVFLEDSDLPQLLKNAKDRLEKRVIGQPIPIRRILRGITTFYAGLNDPKRPVGVFLFAGPSGSGKTYLAEELAGALIGNPRDGLSPLVTVDCGSLSLEHTVASLTGSPPGYVGYKDRVDLETVGKYDKRERFGNLDKKCDEITDQLTEELSKRNIHPDLAKRYDKAFQDTLAKIRKKAEEEYKPFRSVVLFDEIEKANMNIQSQLLRILDEGILRLHNGRIVDFRGSIIILTTNVGTEQILSEYLREEKIGFVLPHKEKIDFASDLNEKIYRRVLKEITDTKKRYFKTELLGRIGKPGIIVFNVLNYQDYQKILDLRLEEFQDSFLKDDGPGLLIIFYTLKFRKFLIEEGVSPIFGARALREVIDKYVRMPISEKILQGQLKAGDKILLDIKFQKKEGYTIISRRQRPDKTVFPDFKTRLQKLEIASTEQINYAFDDFLDAYLKEIDLRNKKG